MVPPNHDRRSACHNRGETPIPGCRHQRSNRDVPHWWNWNLSAKARLASMATAWPLLLLAGGPQALLIPILLLRSAASLVQTFWNHRLDKQQPLAPRTSFEWTMLGLGVAACLAFGPIQGLHAPVPDAVILAAVMAPFSAAQAGAVRRSFQLHETLAAPIRAYAIRRSIDRQLGSMTSRFGEPETVRNASAVRLTRAA